MKIFTNLAAYILIFLVLYGCNDDVFVDDFRISDSEFTLDGNGDAVTIRFASSNWDLVWMYTYDSDFTHQYEVYDADDNLIMKNQDVYLKGLGKIVCNEKLTDFIIQRSNPKELKITVGENVRNDYFRFMLVVSNDYESQEIYVEITPSDRYVFDHITYSLNAYSHEWRLEETKSFIQSNYWDIPYPCLLFPYKDAHHEVVFKSDDPEAFRLLGGDHPTVEKEISIPPNTTQRIIMLLECEWFETEYTLYAVHPKNGRQRTITGTLQSKMPGKCYIARENIK